MKTGLWAFGTAVVSFLVVAVIGRHFIPVLKKLNFTQIEDEESQLSNKKQSVPVFGGVIIVFAVFFVTLAGVLLHSIGRGFDSLVLFVLAGLMYALFNGAIGFIDDYLVIKKKRKKGINLIFKLGLQFLAAALYLFIMYLFKDNTSILVPFAGYVDLGFFYYILMALLLVGIVNAVNLTDGINGLDCIITFLVCFFLMLISSALGSFESNVIYAAAVAGGCLGFLIWSFSPERCFLGNTGSLFLGGVVCSVAFAMDMQLILILISLIYLIEASLVVIQTCYSKLTHGKLLLKRVPFQRYLEHRGVSKAVIIGAFFVVTVLCGIGSLLLVISG